MLKFRCGILSALTLALAAPAFAQTPAAPPPPSTPPGSTTQGTAPPPSSQGTRPPAPSTPSAPQTQPSAPASAPTQAAAQTPTGSAALCGQAVPPPAKLPPSGSGPILYMIAPCFQKQGGSSVIDSQTYLYYIQARPSRPSTDQWIPFDDKMEQILLDDFRRLWATNFLADLSIEVRDYTFTNGVVGKLVVYDMEERERIKIVDYVGTKQLEQTKIDEKLREENVQIRLDSFVDDGLVRRVKSIIRGMLSEKGFLDSTVTHAMKEVGGGPKLVHLTFTISEGPKYKVRDIDFVGNKAVGDGTLKRKMKETKEQWAFSFITGRGTYKEDKFEEDADKVQSYYRDKGYITTQVGNPEIRTLETTKDDKTRYIQLRIPVSEGPRYRVGNFDFAENKVVKGEALRPLFKLEDGDYYSEKHVRKGLEKARELYGSGGYFEFTGYPEFKRRDEPEAGTAAASAAATRPGAPAIVDVTMHMQEGEQFFVNRITFTGNSTTRDHVIRREMRLVENGIFNTEALKYSVKRLNQLGYFKPLEGNEAINVQKTPNAKNQVDVTLKFEEQNRNQLTFGAGFSQFEGAFGQFAFQTSNFMGRGETVSLSVLTGRLYRDYQINFTEPFLFDRPITGGVNLFTRQIDYQAYKQRSSGGNLMFGFPLRDFTRAFIGYSLENIQVREVDPSLIDNPNIADDPFLQDLLLLSQGGSRVVSKISPSVVYNTVDNPIFPTTGKRLTGSFELAGMGGNTKFYKPTLEAITYFQHTRRTSLGMRGQFAFVQEYGSTQALPIFERLVLGGEYSVRGYDIRSIGPKAPNSRVVIGGNKSLLFNGEYLIQIAGPVRLVMFYDAGQVRAAGQGFEMDEFRISTGAEVRFFMPVLNVPFRLIFARNFNEIGVLNSAGDYEQTPKFRFRFAVGSTF